MTLAAFAGLALLSCGPPVVLYCTFLARKSLLVLLTLASTFAWLVVLILVAALFRGFAPLPARGGPYAAVLLVTVVVEEAVRYGLWQLHRRAVVVLNGLAAEAGSSRLTPADRQLLALAYGVGQGAAHSVFLSVSWLPLAIGPATLYADACPQMSYFLYSALCSLAFFCLHAFSMVVYFDGWESGDKRRITAPPVAHLAAALLTLANLASNGCVATLPLLLLAGLGAAAAAGYVALERAQRAQLPVSTGADDEPS